MDLSSAPLSYSELANLYQQMKNKVSTQATSQSGFSEVSHKEKISYLEQELQTHQASVSRLQEQLERERRERSQLQGEIDAQKRNYEALLKRSRSVRQVHFHSDHEGIG